MEKTEVKLQVPGKNTSIIASQAFIEDKQVKGQHCFSIGIASCPWSLVLLCDIVKILLKCYPFKHDP